MRHHIKQIVRCTNCDRAFNYGPEDFCLKNLGIHSKQNTLCADCAVEPIGGHRIIGERHMENWDWWWV
jgi:hypothetical protein